MEEEQNTFVCPFAPVIYTTNDSPDGDAGRPRTTEPAQEIPSWEDQQTDVILHTCPRSTRGKGGRSKRSLLLPRPQHEAHTQSILTGII
jgi:hypothetical protein